MPVVIKTAFGIAAAARAGYRSITPEHERRMVERGGIVSAARGAGVTAGIVGIGVEFQGHLRRQ